MNPNYHRLDPAQALTACAVISSHVTGAPNPYDLTPDQIAGIAEVHGELAAAVQAQSVSAADLKAKVRAKDASLHTVAGVLSYAAKTAMNSNATDAQLAQIGMARPAKPVRPTSLPLPVDLVVKGVAGGAVRLAWDRNGNPQGTAFSIEWSPDGLAWEMVEVTTRASLTLSGYAPGAAAWFRVTAKRAGLSSLPSEPAAVYAPTAAARPALRVA